MSRGARKVLVIGAQGALGRLCVPALRNAGFDVIRAGRRPESASDFRLIDLDKVDSIPEDCADADLVISMVNDSRRTVERLVLRNGGAMFSLMITPSERSQVKALGEGAKGLVVTDVGLGPGITNLVLKDLLIKYPETDCLEGAGTFSVLEPTGRATAEEFSYPGLTSAGRHPTAMVEFPEPFGRRRCIEFRHADIGPGLFGDVSQRLPVRFYGYTLERAVNASTLALNSLGLLSKLPLALFTVGSDRRAASTVAKPQCHVCAVLRDGRRLAATAVMGRGNFAMTADATAMMAENLLARRDKGESPTGVLSVEDVFDLSELTPGLERRGIRIAEMG